MMKRVDVNGGSEKSDSEKNRPDICHVCMTRGELGKDLFYCARCKVLSRLMRSQHCWNVGMNLINDKRLNITEIFSRDQTHENSTKSCDCLMLFVLLFFDTGHPNLSLILMPAT